MYDTRAQCVNSAPCAGSLKAFRDIELRTRSHSLQVLSFDGQLASTVELSLCGISLQSGTLAEVLSNISFKHPVFYTYPLRSSPAAPW